MNEVYIILIYSLVMDVNICNSSCHSRIIELLRFFIFKKLCRKIELVQQIKIVLFFLIEHGIAANSA